MANTTDGDGNHALGDPIRRRPRAREWVWPVFPGLIGTDAMLYGGGLSASTLDSQALPPKRRPYPIELRTWVWPLSVDLLGHDGMLYPEDATGEGLTTSTLDSQALPPKRRPYPMHLRTWISSPAGVKNLDGPLFSWRASAPEWTLDPIVPGWGGDVS